MKKIIFAYFLLLTLLIYGQPTGEEKNAKVSVQFCDDSNNILSFDRSNNFYIEKNNKESTITFFYKTYAIDFETQTSKIDEKSKKLITEFYPFDLKTRTNFDVFFFSHYQKTGWNNEVTYQNIIILWKRKNEEMKIILRPNVSKNIDLLNPPKLNIYFRKGIFEIVDLDKYELIPK